MAVYRVINKKYREMALSGIGAEKAGGRWNKIGTRAGYCSENISLALLEYYVHSENIATLPKKLMIAKIQIPDDFVIEELTVCPEGWNAYPYRSKTTEIFSGMANDRNFFALRVPSAIIGLESNYILNPLYREFGKVAVAGFIELPIDERLWDHKKK